MSKTAFFWFRRDLRWEDNAGLYRALKAHEAVRLVFIFDETLLAKLSKSETTSSLKKDHRVLFIHQTLQRLQKELQDFGGDLEVYHGQPQIVWKKLLQEAPGSSLYCNHDYEPKAQKRDEQIQALCEKLGSEFHSFKDQVIFEKEEVLNGSDLPYTVFTPYKKKWLQLLSPFYLKPYPVKKYFKHLSRPRPHSKNIPLPSLKQLGFEESEFPFPSAKPNTKLLKEYALHRDLPGLDATSRLGIHLRFGTVSIRQLVAIAKETSQVWLSELIWREFFMQILFHFPHVESSSFRPAYDKIAWRNSPADLKRWKEGKTGYPMVDAGMRELNATGFMHNRARMVTASFLTKHLLIHWKEGEKYFAEKLLDYDLAANNGNWQWAAGSGCDASPYFRVFNPETQRLKFDKSEEYVRKWIPEYGTERYPEPMVDHGFARMRALREYQSALKGL
jgi:deoxyribodipyrimidine photo-lyase